MRVISMNVLYSYCLSMWHTSLGNYELIYEFFFSFSFGLYSENSLQFFKEGIITFYFWYWQIRGSENLWTNAYKCCVKYNKCPF